MRKVTYYKFLGCIYLIFIYVFFTLNMLCEDRHFSSMENRTLATTPIFSLERLLEGSYSSKYETYVNDQFYGRDDWVKLKSQVDLFMGQRESHQVYYASDDYLIEDFYSVSEEMVIKNLTAINMFSPQLKTSFIMVPNAISILRQKLPRNAPEFNQQEIIDEFSSQLDDNIVFYNPYEMLMSHEEEYIYYKNDHHWSTLGAYYTFLQWADIIGLESLIEEYEVLPVTNTFDGTLTAKSGYGARSLDTIEVYLPKTDVQWVVTYVEEQKKTTSLYDIDFLLEKDKYAIFLGGNHALVEIQTTNLNNQRLLILKDSYANAFVPFLTPYYEKIVIVDPRYYFDDLRELIEQEEINELLYLYNANTFFTDNSLNLVLNNE